MGVVEAGDRVALHYILKDVDGARLAGSETSKPLEIVAGAGDAIPGVSRGVIGMRAGERKTLRLEPAQAFGGAAARVERVVLRDRLPPEAVLGDAVRISLGGISMTMWLVEEVGDTGVRLCTEHPFSGKVLIAELTLVELKSRGRGY